MGEGAVIITGGGTGIGRACAELFSERGFSVILVDLLDRDGVAKSLSELGREAEFRRCDVAREEEVRETAEGIRRDGRKISALLNVAGVIRVAPIEAATWDDYRRMVDVNLGGTFLMCKHVAPIMRSQGGGQIVNIASVSGHVGSLGHALYGATKGGIIALTKALAVELAPSGIRVNCVSPGAVETSMLRASLVPEAERKGVSFEALKKEREGAELLGHWAKPRELAEVVYFLATESSSFVTGSDFVADGGWTAR